MYGNNRRYRYPLFILLIVIGLNALGGGYYGMTGAPAVPVEWLDGSPFKSYFLPGLLLFLMGGLFLFTAYCLWKQQPYMRLFSILSGALLMLWITTQLVVIGYVSWLQPAMLISGLVIIILGTQVRAIRANT